MHLQESGPRGSKLDPLAFFPGVCSWVICFPVGVQPPQPPANFYPVMNYHNGASAEGDFDQ